MRQQRRSKWRETRGCDYALPPAIPTLSGTFKDSGLHGRTKTKAERGRQQPRQSCVGLGPRSTVPRPRATLHGPGSARSPGLCVASPPRRQDPTRADTARLGRRCAAIPAHPVAAAAYADGEGVGSDVKDHAVSGSIPAGCGPATLPTVGVSAAKIDKR